MKEKYADQDEEEKELRLKLTGAKNIKELREESSDDDNKKGKKKGKDKDKDKGKSKGGKQQDQVKGKQQQQQNGKKPNQGNQGQNQGQNQHKKPQSSLHKPLADKTDILPAEIKATKQEEATNNIQKQNEAISQPKIEKAKENIPENKETIPKEDIEETKKSDDDKEEEEEELNEIAYDKEDLEDVQEGEGEVANSQIDVTQDAGQDPQSELDELKMLISVPHPEDTLLFAVPICAPYMTLINYKYKSKLVPGTLKKGKAVKTVMSVFQSQKELSEVEKKLMRTMGEAELVNAMIGNVKIGVAGLLKVKEKEKKAKDQKKKELRNQEKKKKE